MLKFPKRMMLLVLLASAGLVSCEKKSYVPVEEKAGTTEAEKAKFQRIERFISIMWQVPANEVLYDKNKKEFSFGNVTISKDEMEKIYDVSNEYKLNYERY